MPNPRQASDALLRLHSTWLVKYFEEKNLCNVLTMSDRCGWMYFTEQLQHSLKSHTNTPPHPTKDSNTQPHPAMALYKHPTPPCHPFVRTSTPSYQGLLQTPYPILTRIPTKHHTPSYQGFLQTLHPILPRIPTNTPPYPTKDSYKHPTPSC